jgi:hypothetical protein
VTLARGTVIAVQAVLSDPVRENPIVARIRAVLAETDPELIDAIDEVDRTLIVSSLARDPWDRVRTCVANANYLTELRQCLASTSKR